MKKIILLLAAGIFSVTSAQNAKGPKIGYFDMNEILKSVPEFAQANNQLELKAQTWKKEISDRQAKINLLIEELKTERVLLTKELIEEKEEEIAFLEKELSDYQQKRFGPTGDLYTQKAVLIKPIQDQVFAVVNEVAERRKYDFVYDMSSASNGLVFAQKRFNMNEEIVNSLTRAAKRDQSEKKKMSKEQEIAEDDKKYDPDLKLKEEQRQAKVDERKKQIEERKEAAQKKREEALEQRQNKANEAKSATAKKKEAPSKEEAKEKIDEQLDQEDEEIVLDSNLPAEEDTEDDKPKKLTKEERQAMLEARKQQIQEQRAQKIKERQEAAEARKREAQERKEKKESN